MTQSARIMLRSVVAVIATVACLASGSVRAHFPWIGPPDEAPKEGEALALGIHMGHDFQADTVLETYRVAEFVVAIPRGEFLELVPDGTRFVSPVIPVHGPYVAAAAQERGYYTRTIEGGQRAPRSETSGALHCSFSGNAMKTIIGSGDVAGHLNTVFGHTLELVPLDMPKVGADMRVRVLYRGAPHSMQLELYGANGTRMTIDTDAAGTATLTPADGAWLIVANVRSDYHDPNVCDVESTTSTLSFKTRRDD